MDSTPLAVLLNQRLNDPVELVKTNHRSRLQHEFEQRFSIFCQQVFNCRDQAFRDLVISHMKFRGPVEGIAELALVELPGHMPIEIFTSEAGVRFEIVQRGWFNRERWPFQTFKDWGGVLVAAEPRNYRLRRRCYSFWHPAPKPLSF